MNFNTFIVIHAILLLNSQPIFNPAKCLTKLEWQASQQVVIATPSNG